MPDRFPLLILDFLDSIRSEKGLSPHTVEAYGRDIRLFASTLAVKEWKEVSPEAILRFLAFLKEKKYASSSICQRLRRRWCGGIRLVRD